MHIPTTQRALRFETFNGPLEVKRVPVPEPDDDELLVKIEYSGICHSDLHAWLGDLGDFCTSPLVGGHEGVGTVVKVGGKVRGWKVGERAGIKITNFNCFNCEFCKKGHEPQCEHVRNYGFSCDGTFQQYLTVRGVDAIRVTMQVRLADAAPVLCAGVTAYTALKESGAKTGQIVCLTGAGGGLGSLAIQYANVMGLRVIAVDHGSKEEHCRKLGAEWFVDAFNTPDIVNHIIELSDGGPHAVVNFAVSKLPMEQALRYIRKRGTVVFVGLPKDATIPLDATPLIFNAVTIKGSLIGSRQDADEAMELVGRGKVNVPIELVSIEDVPAIYKRMLDGNITSRAVIDFSL